MADETPGAPPAAPTPPVAPPRPMTPGPTSPATVTPQSEGMKARGRLMATWGLNLLEQSVKLLGGTQDEDGAEVMTLVLKGRKRFGDASRDLTQQEVKLAGTAASPIQQPTPQMGEAWQQMVKQKLQGSLPGAA